jgi:ADP-heptose:LPS heptosyltransferase
LPAAFLLHLADIPLRLLASREDPGMLATDWARGIAAGHDVRQQLELVAAIGCRPQSGEVALRLRQRARSAMADILEVEGVDLERPWVAVHPGASTPCRLAPRGAFAEAARRLTVEMGLPLVFFGAEEDRRLVEEARAAVGEPSFSVVGCFDLEETAALIGRASLLLACSSPAVALAAGVGTPVVLCGPSHPEDLPWGTPGRAASGLRPCRDCGPRSCPGGRPLGADPEAVIEDCRELLQGRLEGAAGDPVEDAAWRV